MKKEKKKEVYCRNCKYYVYVSPYLYGGTNHLSHKCIHDARGKDFRGVKVYMIENARILNKDTNCEHYKRKFFRFWA